MGKTKIGIKASLFGAGIYFLAIMGLFPLVLAVGYVLVIEQNDWLKRVALRAIGIVIIFGILSALVGILSNSSALLNDIVNLFDGSINLIQLNRVISLINRTLSIVQTILLLIFGFATLKGKDKPFNPIDKLVSEKDNVIKKVE